MGNGPYKEKETIEAACPCGNARLTIHAPPRFRMYCHRTICQRFNQAPFADVLVYRARDVDLPELGAVEFDTYKPPAQRPARQVHRLRRRSRRDFPRAACAETDDGSARHAARRRRPAGTGGALLLRDAGGGCEGWTTEALRVRAESVGVLEVLLGGERRRVMFEISGVLRSDRYCRRKK